MTRIPVYIRTARVGPGLPPERTYTFNSDDAVLLGTVVKPGENHYPEAWSPVEIVRRAIEGRWGFRWEPRDMAVPAPSPDPDNPAATEAGERQQQAAAWRAGEIARAGEGEETRHKPKGRAMTSLESVWAKAQENHRRYSDTGTQENDIRFLALGLVGEAGEVANFVKKRWRDGEGHDEDIRLEIADVCAYAFMLASSMGMSPADLIETIAHKQEVFVAKMNARDSAKEDRA